MRRTAYAVVAAAVALAAAPDASARIVATKGFGPGAGRIVIAHSDGSHVHRLAQGDDAQIAPNGKLVEVTNFDPGQQGTHPRVMVYRAVGGKPLFVIRKNIFPPAWSPDSKLLVGLEFVNLTDDRLVVIDAKTGARTGLLTGDLDYPTFSPDSTQIAFVTYGPGINYGGTLKVMDLATRSVRTLAEHASRPVWGPQAIAFETVFHNEYHFSNLALIHPDGSGFRTLTNVPPRQTSGFYPVDWSDDGTRLLAGYYDQVTPITYAIDPIHGGARRLVRGVYPQALSRDGRRVIGGTGNPFCCLADPINVVRVPWSGGKPHILIRKAFDASSSD
jgi:WD40-like Beta Propeller Repeat